MRAQTVWTAVDTWVEWRAIKRSVVHAAVGPDPDPDKQRMSVLAPGPARKELTRALSSFFADFEAAHMSAGQCVSFGDESCIAQIVLPLARRVHEGMVDALGLVHIWCISIRLRMPMCLCVHISIYI